MRISLEIAFDDRTWGSIPWLKKFTIYGEPRAFATLEFETDAHRNITSWSIDIGDDSPDIVITTSGDRLIARLVPPDFSEDNVFFSAPPGIWSEPTVVPIPPGILLLLTAIAMTRLGGIALRRLAA